MKKCLLLSILICGLACKSKAQQAVSGTVFSMGSNISFLQGQDISGDPLAGFETGIGVFKRYNRSFELQATVGYRQVRFNINDVENDAGIRQKLRYPVNTFYNDYVLLWYPVSWLAVDAGMGWSLNFARHYASYRLPTSNGNDYYSLGRLDMADATPYTVVGLSFGHNQWQFGVRHEFVLGQKVISGNTILSGYSLGNNTLQRITLNIRLKLK